MGNACDLLLKFRFLYIMRKMADSVSRVKSDEVVTIAKGAGTVFLGMLAGMGLRFLYRAVIGRYLGPSLLGLFLIGLGFFRISERIACLGIQNGVLRYVSLYAGEKDERRLKGSIIFGLKVVAVVGIGVGASIFFVSPLIYSPIYQNIALTEVLRAFAIGVPFSAVTMVLLFATQGFRVMKYKVMVREFLEPLSCITVFSLLILAGWKLEGALFAFVFSIIIGSFLAFYYLRKLFPPITSRSLPSIQEPKKMLGFSWPLFFVGFFYLIILWLNTLLIGYFLSSADVGLFGAANNIAMLGMIVVNSFVPIFAPVVSDLSNRKKMDALESLYKVVTKWIFTLSFPLFVLMIFFRREVLILSFGKEFVEGAGVLVILSIALLANAMIGASGFLTAMSGKPKIELVNLGLVLFINTVLSIILIPKSGIQGAACSTLAAFLFLNVLRIIEVRVIFRIHPFRQDLYKPIVSGGISLAILFVTMRYFSLWQGPLGHFAQGSFFFVITYVLSLFLFGLEEEDKLIFSRIRDKMKSR
jgi:O-antigen/teichoic acid export membrane protein